MAPKLYKMGVKGLLSLNCHGKTFGQKVMVSINVWLIQEMQSSMTSNTEHETPLARLNQSLEFDTET